VDLLDASALVASKRHMPRDSPGTNVLRMYRTGVPSGNCSGVAADGFEFLLVVRETSAPDHLAVTLGWFAELQRL